MDIEMYKNNSQYSGQGSCLIPHPQRVSHRISSPIFRAKDLLQVPRSQARTIMDLCV